MSTKVVKTKLGMELLPWIVPGKPPTDDLNGRHEISLSRIYLGEAANLDRRVFSVPTGELKLDGDPTRRPLIW
jgi:hypothetical protein